ncbi:hypothetical protein [Pedobacter namyangjuensis]|uniref:hypothetical protein n=1 Tax=Pedobacter namyangjuensis TaxID=600626 RepID=UPI000DE521A5|nr:hypothetical protein [Pedobacter namyangjuensis]
MKKFTLNLNKCAIALAGLCLCFFCSFNVAEEPNVFIQSLLAKFFNTEAESKQIKKFEINVTNTGFCRYRKIYLNGKQEYFSFNLSRFKAMDYYGTLEKGELYLRTQNDDVIVQTRNDKKGDVDSMGTFMVIPLKNIDLEQLNALNDQLKKANTDLVGK